MMTRKAKRWLLGLGAVLAAGFVLLNVLAFNHAYAMTHFTAGGPRTHKPERLGLLAKLKVLFVGVNIPRPASDRQPAELDPACRSLTIPGPEKSTLAAWYCGKGKDAPLVILFHGYATEKTCLIAEARVFMELGASVLLVDFRGSGGSSGSSTTIGVREANDVATAARYAHDSLAPSSVILFGRSMGAAAILRAVHEKSVEPDAVILDAVFDTMLNTARNRFRSMRVPAFPSAELLVFWGGVQFGFNGFAHNPVTYARSLRCPALFMHGTDDPRATLEEGRRVFRAVPGAKEFKEFPSAGHEAYVSTHPEAWRAAVSDFMQKTLVSAGPER